jgi:hypothetical protein
VVIGVPVSPLGGGIAGQGAQVTYDGFCLQCSTHADATTPSKPQLNGVSWSDRW